MDKSKNIEGKKYINIPIYCINCIYCKCDYTKEFHLNPWDESLSGYKCMMNKDMDYFLSHIDKKCPNYKDKDMNLAIY